MIEKIVSSGFRVNPPDIKCSYRVPSSLHIVNCNPQCGSLPLTNLRTTFSREKDHIAFVGDVAPEFVKAQILPRGRPHLSLLHLALIDDNIATSSFAVATNNVYGEEYRYVELGVICCFHREAFIKGSLQNLSRGSIFVDSFRVYWECLSRKDRIPLLQRGIFRVVVMGLIKKDEAPEEASEEVPVASLEGEYFRRSSVLNIAND